MASYGSIWSPLVNNNLKYLEDLSEYVAKIVAYANTIPSKRFLYSLLIFYPVEI